MNQMILSGNLVGNTQNNDKLYQFYPAHDDKKAVLNFLISSQRPFAKKDENGYYPSDLYSCKAFGPTAEFINKYFQAGDAMEIIGYLAIDKGGMKEDGTKYPDRTYISVTNPGFVPASRNRKEGGASSTGATAQNIPVKKATNLGTGMPSSSTKGGFKLSF